MATLVVGLAVMSSACGEFVRNSGRSPAQPVVVSLQAASGADPDELGGTLLSDVITMVRSPEPCTATSPCPTLFNDLGFVAMRLIMKDPGGEAAASSPSLLNQVTFTRYRVTYRRTDGRNTPGVDVPYAFDSAATFTVPEDGEVSAGFQIVRHSAKEEAPLAALANSAAIISTIADVTFYGRDQAGNDVTTSSSIGIDFGNFADPE
jgi:hypothetical protein